MSSFDQEQPWSLWPRGWAARLKLIFGGVIVLAIVALVVGYMFTTMWMPIISIAILWLFCTLAFSFDRADDSPYARAVIALLVAWLADWFLYRVVVVRGDKNLAPAIVVVSALCGFVVWQQTKRASSKDKEMRFAAVAGIFTAIFLFFNLVIPTLKDVAPFYWDNMRTQILDEMGADNGDESPGW